jgi:hypothetical protein
MVSYYGLVLWSRSMVVRWSRWTQQSERGYLCKSGLYTTLALRLIKAGAPLASPCCPCSDPTHLRLSASAYQDACMTISSPFSSALTAVSGQAHLIDRFPACGFISRATHVSMYPCRCTDLEALQLLQRLQLASWNCAREYMALTSPRSHTFQAKQGCLLDCISSWEIQNLEMPQSARLLERH